MKKFPPMNLRIRVHGSINSKSFLDVGQRIKNDLDNILQKITQNKKLENFENVLDFGCGCGRVLLWVNTKEKTKFFGTDISKTAISWCKRNIDDIKCSSNKQLPPLNFSDNFFDVIYGISVFTHLNEEEQFRWLNELERILKTEGFLLISVHDFDNLREKKHIERAKKNGILEKGFAFCKIKSPLKRVILGSSTTKLAYHTKPYVYENYSKFFKILKYVDKGINNDQNLIVLQKIESPD